MDSKLVIISKPFSPLTFDFENKKLYFERSQSKELLRGMLPMEINFSDITAIELREPKFLKPGGCNFIIRNTRYISHNKKFDISFYMAKDFESLKNALLRLKNECSISDFKAFNEVDAPKVVFEDVAEEFAVMKKCDVCGQLLRYTPVDLLKNIYRGMDARRESFASLSGSATSSAVNRGNAEMYMSQIVDYGVCPNCKSKKLLEISKEQFSEEMKAKNAPAVSVASTAPSSADELKKYKDLLDAGIITQEEFDTKKKQLLGL